MPNIIWDWNGTMLNDMDLCIDVVNGMLEKRGLSVIDKEKYQALFCFPVSEFYRAIGFQIDNGAFEAMSNEYIKAYLSRFGACQLQPYVHQSIEKLSGVGFHHYVLSAMEQKALEFSLTGHEITHLFKGIQGITDYHAKGKVQQGIRLFEKYGINPKETYLIGDTSHDYEVANALHCQCVLVANGHFPENRLKRECSAPVVKNIREATTYILSCA